MPFINILNNNRAFDGIDLPKVTEKTDGVTTEVITLPEKTSRIDGLINTYSSTQNAISTTDADADLKAHLVDLDVYSLISVRNIKVGLKVDSTHLTDNYMRI
jgi:hypothetical protein